MIMNIEIRDEKLSVADYLELRARVGWKKLTLRQAELAVDNCLFMATAYVDGKLVGMGRIVGDGAVICYIQDLIVSPDYHGMGIGSKLIDRLRNFVLSLKKEDEEMMLCLMSAKGRETFYIKNGFTERPNGFLGPGMIQYL